MSAALKAGRLFIWQAKQAPKLLALPQLAVRASMGPDHILAVGQSGNLYSLGAGKDGQLGHGDTKDQKQPKIVQYFQKNNIKVKDAIAGQRHSIVLTDKGQVYTFGYGGKSVNLFMKLFVNPVGPTGHGKNAPNAITKPTKLKSIEQQNILRITSGRHFCMALNDKQQVFNWGNGQYAAFGDGANDNYDVPTLNQHFQYLRNQQKLQVQKIKSCQSFSVALMKNGRLYGWGSNQHGQMGIKAQIGMQMYQTVNFVTEVIRDGYDDQKVINFDISDSALIFQLQNDELWYAGMKIAYKPQKLSVGANPRLFAAGQRSLVVVDNNNTVYSNNGFLQFQEKQDKQSITTGFVKIDGNKVFGGEIVGIGGEYSKRYALVV